MSRIRFTLIGTALALSTASLLGCPAPYPAFHGNGDAAADRTQPDSSNEAGVDAFDSALPPDAIDAPGPDSTDASMEAATGGDATDAPNEVIVPDSSSGCDSGGGCDPMCVDTLSCSSCGGCGNVCNAGDFCFNGTCRTDADCAAKCGGRTCSSCSSATPCS